MNNSNPAWLSWLAGIALAAGLAAGAVALAAPMGVWLGLWEFPTGFQLLFNERTGVTAWGLWVAIATAAVGVIVFLAAGMLGASNGPRLAALALIGAVTAAIAYAVPSSYRPGADDNVPPIHDITTDTDDPPSFVDVLPLRASAANTAVYGGGPNQTPASLAAQQRAAYPDIVSQRFDEPPDAVFARAAAAVRELGWDIVAEVPAEGRIEATDTTFWFRFKDDIVIRIRPTATGAVLDARSVSRVGLGDAGKNAARLRELIAAL